MFYHVAMDAIAKLQLFATQMELEPAEEFAPGVSRSPTAGAPVAAPAQAGPAVLPCGEMKPPGRNQVAKQQALGVFNATVSGGQRIPLLKTLLTSACERNCYYCPFRAGRNYRRATFKPEEMARTVQAMYRAGTVRGIFLSSGIINGGVHTQDKLLDTIEILRYKLGFPGYVHLKVMPGAERSQVERAMQLADRLSVNLEAPTTERLQRLAPMKQLVEELVRPLQWIEEIRRQRPAREGWNGRWPSTTTQFVVGAGGETDLELLSTTDYLYRQARLRRAYFSAFRPIEDTPLEDQAPTPPLREHRLYQSSFLLRDYGFDLEDMAFDAAGNLPLEVDPKVAWARQRLQETPLELNRAGRDELLRVPGIGPKGAAAILRGRRHNKLRDLRDLKAIGVVTTRLAPFVLLDGKRPAYQMQMALSVKREK